MALLFSDAQNDELFEAIKEKIISEKAAVKVLEEMANIKVQNTHLINKRIRAELEFIKIKTEQTKQKAATEHAQVTRQKDKEASIQVDTNSNAALLRTYLTVNFEAIEDIRHNQF
ncbi:MAG: hypothetical protein MMC33_010318 [Icmadophila ericetorum]|nr:hypothetical protein [Icmadophila ericetorum]